MKMAPGQMFTKKSSPPLWMGGCLHVLCVTLLDAFTDSQAHTMWVACRSCIVLQKTCICAYAHMQACRDICCITAYLKLCALRTPSLSPEHLTWGIIWGTAFHENSAWTNVHEKSSPPLWMLGCLHVLIVTLLDVFTDKSNEQGRSSMKHWVQEQEQVQKQENTKHNGCKNRSEEP